MGRLSLLFLLVALAPYTPAADAGLKQTTRSVKPTKAKFRLGLPRFLRKGPPKAAESPLHQRIAAASTRARAHHQVGSNRPVNVSVVEGNLVKMPVEAILVPHFRNGASRDSVGAHVEHAGGGQALDAYDAAVAEAGGRLQWGEVVLGRANEAPWVVLNAATVGAGADADFTVTAATVENALGVASEARIKSIAIPLLANGIAGTLTPSQSARAIMAGIERFAEKSPGGAPRPDVTLVVYGPPRKGRAAARVLRKGYYRDAPEAERGKKAPKALVSGEIPGIELIRMYIEE